MQKEDVSELFYLSGIEPQPFLKNKAESDIAEGRCVLCHDILLPDKPRYFCLIGRHKVLSKGDKWSWTEFSILETTRYRIQGAYVRICGRCYTKYSRMSSFVLTFLAITSVLALLLFFTLLILLDKAYYRNLGFIMLIVIASILGIFIFTKSFCDSKEFSSRTVKTNELLPEYGVPDYNGSPYKDKELVSEEEIVEVMLDKAEQRERL